MRALQGLRHGAPIDYDDQLPLLQRTCTSMKDSQAQFVVQEQAVYSSLAKASRRKQIMQEVARGLSAAAYKLARDARSNLKEELQYEDLPRNWFLMTTWH